MSRHSIPNAIQVEAHKLGLTPVFEEIIDGAQVYSLSSGCEGQHFPTGLPVFLTYEDERVKLVEDLDALTLLRRLA